MDKTERDRIKRGIQKYFCDWAYPDGELYTYGCQQDLCAVLRRMYRTHVLDAPIEEIEKIHEEMMEERKCETFSWQRDHGFDNEGFDANGLDEFGFSKNKIHKETGSRYDPEGYDHAGLDEWGLRRIDYTKHGRYYKNGIDPNGRDRYGRTHSEHFSTDKKSIKSVLKEKIFFGSKPNLDHVFNRCVERYYPFLNKKLLFDCLLEVYQEEKNREDQEKID